MSGKNPMGQVKEAQAYEGVNLIVPVSGTTIVKAKRDPTTNDKKYPVTSYWVNTLTNTVFFLTSAPGNWQQVVVGALGALTLNGVLIGQGSAPIIATAAGTTGQVLTAVTGSPPAFSNIGTNSGLTLHGVVVAEGTGAFSATAEGATGTLLSGNTGADPTFTGSPSVSGSITAATSITATAGNITATNGNFVLSTAGNKILVATGTNASAGVSAAMTGTPGAVSIATTAGSATSLIFYNRRITGGTPGHVSITAQSGTGFTLTSTGNETSTFNWWIINA